MVSDNRSLDPPAGSILYEPVRCGVLALYRVRADKDFLDVYETVAGNRHIEERKVRSRGDCVDYLLRGALSHVCIAEVRLGGRYLLRADGRESEPHCFSMVVDKKVIATISSGVANYSRDIQAVKDILAASVDKPLVLAFASASKPSGSSGSRGIEGENDGLVKLQAGSCATRGV